jgi:hypothetical protein
LPVARRLINAVGQAVVADLVDALVRLGSAP